MKALVIEDDYVSGKVIKKMLNLYGECDVASSGEKGLELFFDSFDKKESYDVICLDIMMPEMDGHEVLKRLRAGEEKRGILEPVKVIITSALGDFSNIKEAYREQCEDYIVKPIEKYKIEAALRKLELID
jgi:two-component system, chemotaxis family, chemotaxis protein CheY